LLFEEELELVVPVSHPMTKRKTAYLRDLQGETILLPQSKYLCRSIEEQLRRHRMDVRFLQLSNFGMIKESVKTGLGIAFLRLERMDVTIHHHSTEGILDLTYKGVNKMSALERPGAIGLSHRPVRLLR